MASSTKLWAGSQLLTMSSWDPGWLISTRRATAWDQLSGGDVWHTWDDALVAHPGNWKAKSGEVTKIHSPPGTVCLPSTWSPECLDLGRAQNACSTHRDWARTMSECLVWGYWSAVAYCRGSGCSRLGYGIHPLGQSVGHWCKELTHSKRPWCWERLKAGREGDDRGWDGWMASPTQWVWIWAGGSEVKASAYNVGDLGLISGLGRSLGEGNGNPLQYSCLENPMDGGAWWATVHRVAKSQTRLSDFTLTFHFLGVGDGQGSLMCCSPWGCKEWDTTEWLNWTETLQNFIFIVKIVSSIEYAQILTCFISHHSLIFLWNHFPSSSRLKKFP